MAVWKFRSVYILSVAILFKLNRFVIFITDDMSLSIIKAIRNRRNYQFIFKDTMPIDKFHIFFNKWNFDKMEFMVDLRIDIRTKKMLDITPSQKAALYELLAQS